MNRSHIRRRRLLTNPVTWIAAGLFANAAVLLYGQLEHRSSGFLDMPAFAQALPGGGQMLGARGIYMAPAQLGPSTYGVYIMDTDSATLSVYKVQADTSRFALLAVRSYDSDRLLQDYNNVAPLPRDVQKWVSAQRQRQSFQSDTNKPTVDQTPKPDDNAPDMPAKNP